MLKEDRCKEVIIQSLTNLSERNLADIFAFVILPNHIHLIWRINTLNGKEKPPASFLKFTAPALKKLLSNQTGMLENYSVTAHNKKYEFWQQDCIPPENNGS